MMGQLQSRLARWVRLLALCFPVGLFVVATFALRGDIGFWSDDFYHNRRALDGSVPAIAFTRAWPFWPLALDKGFFIRPLYYQLVPALTTVLWERAWIAHLIQVVCYAGVIVLFWRLKLTLGVARSVARPLALLLLFCPTYFEVVYWVSALPTVLAAGAMIGVFLLIVTFARKERGWWRVVLAGAGVFGVCCLNEQPASAVAGVPLLYWAALPARQQFLSKRHAARAVVMGLACGVPIVIYAALLTTTALPGARGAAGSFVPAEELPARIAGFGELMAKGLVMRGFAPGAWRLGMELVGSWAIACAVLGMLGVAWIVRRDPVRAPELDGSRPRPVPLMLFGAVMFGAGWVPAIAMRVADPDSRLRYWPCLGLAIVLGAACTFASRRSGIAIGGRAGAGVLMLRAALVLILSWWTVIHVGIQSAYRTRWLRDCSEASQLRALIPNPPAATQFAPVDVQGTGVETGVPGFDQYFQSVWRYPWTTNRFAQQIFGREDVSCVYFLRRNVPIRGANERGLLYHSFGKPRYAQQDDQGWVVPWGRVLPFVVDADGKVKLVTTVVIPTEAGSPDSRIGIDLASGQPLCEVTLPRR
jgi:hypothetical protein